MKNLLVFTLLFLALSACTTVPSASPTRSPTQAPAIAVTAALAPTVPSTLAPTNTGAVPPTGTAAIPATVTVTLPATAAPAPSLAGGQGCVAGLPTIVAPTLPAVIPKTNELDTTTGMHMTGVVQQLDLATYRLKVTGMVDHPLNLTLDDLRCMPKVSATPLLACGDLFKDSAAWAGVPIQDVLKLAGVQAGAKTVILAGADGYRATLALADALQPQNYLAYEWEGQPLPILHGFPLRAVIPDFGGWAWVKWLVEMDVE